MQECKIKKTYLTILEGEINSIKIWKDELVRDKNRKITFVNKSSGGKTAITKIIPIVSGVVKNTVCSLVIAEITTGRTHQIRAQSAAHGYPLVGDRKYGGHGKGGFFLHSWKLEFQDVFIEAPLPAAFREKIIEIKHEFQLPRGFVLPGFSG
jgi:23S rRNA pseudouridine955/2504/2580 synthase